MPGLSTTRHISLGEVRHQFDHIPLPVCITRGRRFVYENSAAASLFDVEMAESLMGRDPIEPFHPDWRKEAAGWLDRQGRVVGITAQILNSDGTVKDVVVSAWPISLDDTSAVQIVLQGVQTPSRVSPQGRSFAVDQLHAAELNAVLVSLADAVYVGDRNGIYICNEPALQMLGFESEQELRDSVGSLARKIQTRDPVTGERLA